MSGPYRTPSEPAEEVPPPRTELGVLKSEHSRVGAIAAASGGWPQVDLYENGLVHRSVASKTVIPFDEVDAVHYDCDALIPGPPRVVLVTFEGLRAAIPSDLRDLDRVLAAIDREVTRPITTRAKEALARGERLTFGPIVLELDGLVLKGETLSWKGLSRVDAERDSLVFYAREPRGRFGWARLVDIPHPRAFLDVLRVRTTVVMRGLRLV